MSESKSFAGEIWKTLSTINCNGQIEKKNGLSYLSWAWAWGILMEKYPESTYHFDDTVYSDSGAAEIWCTVEVVDGERKFTRRMWLPVMNHQNKAIINPDVVEINKTRMRCLTKCLAMFGLGHYIYAGEDLPESEKPKPETLSPEQAAEIKGLIEQTNTDVKRFLTAFGNLPSVDQMLTSSFEQAKTLLLKKMERVK